MKFSLPIAGDIFYAQLSSWYTNNKMEGIRIYGDRFQKLWVKGQVVRVSDIHALISFPSLMEFHERKASYFHKTYITKMLTRSQLELSLEDFFALNPAEATEKAASNFEKLQQYKASGAQIVDAAAEIHDYDEASAETRKRGLRQCNPPLLDELIRDSSASNSKKKQCKIASFNLSLATPLYCPREKLMSFFREACQGIRDGLVAWRHNPNGLTTVELDSKEVSSVLVPYLKASNFSDETLPEKGSNFFAFSCAILGEVQKTMASRDFMPEYRDPLTRAVFFKDTNMIKMVKRIRGFDENSFLIVNPRAKLQGVSVSVIRQAMQLEMGNEYPTNAETMSRTALLGELFQHRLQSKSYLFVDTLYQIVVNDSNLFRIEIEPGRRGYSKSLINISYTVSKERLKWYENRTSSVVVDKIY